MANGHEFLNMGDSYRDDGKASRRYVRRKQEDREQTWSRR
jgi:hypothetical protein